MTETKEKGNIMVVEDAPGNLKIPISGRE